MSLGTLIVTGAGRGIGAATARRAAQDGWDVVLAFLRNRAAAEAVAVQCREHGVRTEVVCADVATEMDVLDLFEQAQKLGPVRALVNNAGVISPLSTVAEMESEDLEQVFAVNVYGAFYCAREAVRLMQSDGGGGSIVNVSSRAAVLGGKGRYVGYAASKAAVDTLTVGLAAEVAERGIRVNAVRPGIIDTTTTIEMGHPDDPETLAQWATTIPLGRFGTPEEVAEAIVWLLSPAASYVTGTILDVAGGR